MSGTPDQRAITRLRRLGREDEARLRAELSPLRLFLQRALGQRWAAKFSRIA